MTDIHIVIMCSSLKRNLEIEVDIERDMVKERIMTTLYTQPHHISPSL
jgi:hypothetical protein